MSGRPVYDWPGAARLVLIVASGLVAWLIFAAVWHLIRFLISLI